MLNQDHLLLSESHIFLSPDFSLVKLCYFPLSDTSFTTSLKRLFDYLLIKVDHKDEQCVRLCYTLHKACYNSNFTISTLYSYISSPEASADISDISLFKPEQKNISDTKSDIKYINKPKEDYNHKKNISPVNKTNQMSDSKKTGISFKDLHQKSILSSFEPALCLKLLALIFIFIILNIINVSLYINGTFNINTCISIFIIILSLCGYNGFHLYKGIGHPVLNKSASDTAQKKKYNTPHPDLSGSDSFTSDSFTSDSFTSDSFTSDSFTSDSFTSDSVISDSPFLTDATVLLSSDDDTDCHRLISSNLGNEEDIKISCYPFTIGKNTSCDYILKNPAISRIHARIGSTDEKNDAPLYIEDLNSTNGTYLNNSL